MISVQAGRLHPECGQATQRLPTIGGGIPPQSGNWESARVKVVLSVACGDATRIARQVQGQGAIGPPARR